MRIESPLRAARVVSLIFEGVVGADSHLKMKVGIGGGAGLSHDADLGSAGDGVTFGVTGNQVVRADGIGSDFIVLEMKIPRVEFGHALAFIGHRATAQFGDVVLENDNISARVAGAIVVEISVDWGDDGRTHIGAINIKPAVPVVVAAPGFVAGAERRFEVVQGATGNREDGCITGTAECLEK